MPNTHRVKVAIKECLECGRRVPEQQQYPYRGHSRTCALRARWIAHDQAVAAWRGSTEYAEYVAKWGG